MDVVVWRLPSALLMGLPLASLTEAFAAAPARIAGAAANASVRDANGRPIRSADGSLQTTTSIFTPEAYTSRNIQATQRGTTVSDEQSKGGAARWTASSDLEQQFIQNAHDIATKIGVDISQAPQFRGAIRLLPEEHTELSRFVAKPNDETNAGNAPLNRASLLIPDDPSLTPRADMPDAKDWKTLVSSTKLVDLIRAHENGDPTLEYLPARITDDATRVALIMKGWD